MPNQEIFFGKDGKAKKYYGKTIEQVAFINYAYLPWIKQNLHWIKPGAFLDNLEEVIGKLNNFISQQTCACGNHVTQTSVILTYLHGSIAGISAGAHYSCCDNEDCGSTAGFSEKTRLYPIKFSIIGSFPAFPRYVQKDVQEALNDLAGLHGRITPENARKCIDDLVLKP